MTANLTNRDLVKVARKVVTQEYFKLGHVLGYDHETLSELLEQHESGCTLMLLLLWRDEQPETDDIRGHLVESLNEAGLVYQSTVVLGGGTPTSPSADVGFFDDKPPVLKEAIQEEIVISEGSADHTISSCEQDGQKQNEFKTSEKEVKEEETQEQKTTTRVTDESFENGNGSARIVTPVDENKVIEENPEDIEQNSSTKKGHSVYNTSEFEKGMSNKGIYVVASHVAGRPSVTPKHDPTKQYENSPQPNKMEKPSPDRETTSAGGEGSEKSGPPQKPARRFDVIPDLVNSNHTRSTDTTPKPKSNVEEDIYATPKKNRGKNQTGKDGNQSKPVNGGHKSASGKFEVNSSTEFSSSASKSSDNRPEIVTTTSEKGESNFHNSVESSDLDKKGETALLLTGSQPSGSLSVNHVASTKARLSFQGITDTSANGSASLSSESTGSVSDGQRRHTLPNITPDSLGKRGKGGATGTGLSDGVLIALSNDVESEEQVRSLGKALGIKENDLSRYLETNRQVDSKSSNAGTKDMLLEWKQDVDPEDQMLLLKHALRRCGLRAASERLKKVDPHERRKVSDAVMARIDKNLTLQSLRKKLEEHYKGDMCQALSKLDCMSIDPAKTVIVVNKEVKRGKTLTLEKVILEDSINDILRRTKGDTLAKRIAIIAPPSLGKTTTVAKMVYDWTHSNQDSPLTDVPLLFALRMQLMNNQTSLGQAVVSQLLGNDKEVSVKNLEEFIENNQSKCMVILDGLEEFKGDLFAKKFEQLHRILHNVKYPECRVIITSRPNFEHFFDQGELPNVYTKVEIQGFSSAHSKSFIRNFFKDDRKANDMIYYLEGHDVINDLVRTPFFCILACNLWKGNLLQTATTQTKFFDSINLHLLRNSREKGNTKLHERDLDDLILSLGDVALQGLLEDTKKRFYTSGDFKKASDVMTQSLDIGIVARSTNKKKDDGSVEFYQKLARDHCAGKVLASEVAGRFGKGRQVKTEKALQRIMTDPKEFEDILRFAASAGNDTSARIMEMVSEATNLKDGDKCRILLGCFAEVESVVVDGDIASVVQRFLRNGTIFLNFPTVSTVAGLSRLPKATKQKITSVKVLTANLSRSVAEKMAAVLAFSEDLLKLEMEDAKHAAHPVLLLLMHKLSLHQSPDNVTMLLQSLHSNVLDRLRLINIAGCRLSASSTTSLWAAMKRCRTIDELAIHDSLIASSGNLPDVTCVRSVKAGLSEPSTDNDHRWLTSILCESSDIQKVDLTLGAGQSMSSHFTTTHLQEHMFIANGRIKLFRLSSASLRVLEAIPDSFRSTITSLTILHSDLSGAYSHPVCQIIKSFARLENFTPKECTLSEELSQLMAFHGASSLKRPSGDEHRMQSLKSTLSSPLGDRDLEWMTTHLVDSDEVDTIDITVSGPARKSPSALGESVQEYFLVEHGRMELCSISSVTITILRLLPSSFDNKITSVSIHHSNISSELAAPLWSIMQSYERLESFSTENCILPKDLPHLTTVCQVKIGVLPRHCVDWDWLKEAYHLEELEVSMSSARKEEDADKPGGQEGAGDGRSSDSQSDVEHFRFRLSHGQLLVSNMTTDSLLVMLNLCENLKREIRYIRVSSRHMTIDFVKKLSSVLQLYECLPPMTIDHVTTGASESEVILRATDSSEA